MNRKVSKRKMTQRVSAPGNRWLHVAIALPLLISRASCSTFKKTPPSPVVTSTTTNATSTAEQFQHALELLQQGNAQGADADLHTYLKSVPESTAATYLISQIETPLSKVFPPVSFSVRSAKNVARSSHAPAELSNSLAFYGRGHFN